MSCLIFANQVPLVSEATPTVDSATSTDSSIPADSSVSTDSSASATEDIDANTLARQVAYLQQLNLPNKMAQLQQSVQDLQGLIEMQGHQINQLQIQQRKLYGDLDQRITSLSNSAKPVMPASTMPLVAPAVSTHNLPAESVSDQKETQIYQSAFNLIQQKQYSDAIPALMGYLKQYPSGRYAVNAHYWLGELYAIAGQNAQAVQEFTVVVTSYSDSNKAPDAMLKLGILANEQSQVAQAKEWWGKLIKQYPQSSAARIADAQLKQLDQAGP